MSGDNARRAQQNPFQDFEQSIDKEQLETWEEMHEKVKGLVQAEEDEDVEIDDSLLVASNAMEIEIPGIYPPTASSSRGSVQGLAASSSRGSVQGPTASSSNEPVPGSSNSSSITSVGTVQGFTPSMELTLQYLSGKITFLEFSEMMEKENGIEDQSSSGEPVQGLDTVIQSVAEQENWNKESSASPKKLRKDGFPRKKKRRKCELPRVLESHMGEVNMTFALGNHELAIQQCLEVIRQAPEASKPFQTLGMIYEDMGDMQNSLQYSLIAAYLDPSDGDEWARLAEMSLDQNDVNQAIRCFTQAISVGGPNKLDCLWERSRLYESMKEYRKSLEGYQALLPLLPESDTEKYFKLAWAITRSYYEQGEKKRALETITNAFKDHPNQITSEDVNLLLELLILEKNYLECIKVMVQHCGVVFRFPGEKFPGERTWCSNQPLPIQDVKNILPVSCEVPQMLPVDLICKLAVSMINLKYIKLVKAVVKPMFDEDIEVTGDLYLDVAEAYMDNGYYKHAAPLLASLVHTQNYHLAAVWLRYGECLKSLGDVETAVKAYTKVVELAPNHIGARMSLSALQQQMGLHEEALEALHHEEIEERRLTKEEQQLLLQKCHLLHGQGKLDEFLLNAKQLLFQDWRDVEAENMNYLQAIATYRHRKESITAHFMSKGKDFMKLHKEMRMDRKFTHAISYEDLKEMFTILCKSLIEEKRYSDFEDVSLLGMLCPLFNQNDRIEQDFTFFILTADIVTKNPMRSYAFARYFVMQDLESIQCWNMFMQVIMMCNDTRHNRFCLRRMLHLPNNIPLGIMNGHTSMASGSYKHSLGEYANVFRKTPTDPMLSLCIGLDFVHCASQRFAAKRHYLVTQGIAFLNNYCELRGESQETFYNVGRALHQINVLYAAVHYYKRVLALPPCIGDRGGMFDLTKEAAYNLALIYSNSGSDDYSRYLLYKYCVI